MGCIRDRVSTLRELYGAGPLAIDSKSSVERASQVATRCELGCRRCRTHQPQHRATPITGRPHRLPLSAGYLPVATCAGNPEIRLPPDS